MRLYSATENSDDKLRGPGDVRFMKSAYAVADNRQVVEEHFGQLFDYNFTIFERDFVEIQANGEVFYLISDEIETAVKKFKTEHSVKIERAEVRTEVKEYMEFTGYDGKVEGIVWL